MAHMYGWTGTLLRINLTTNEVSTQSIEPYIERFIGGRGIVTKLYWDEVSENVDALHPDSPLMFMTGPLAGTGAIACSRWIVAGKSPLQYPDQFGLGNAGGSFGIKLKAAGFDGIIVTGKAAHPVYLYIHDGTVEVKDARGSGGWQPMMRCSALLRLTVRLRVWPASGLPVNSWCGLRHYEP